MRILTSITNYFKNLLWKHHKALYEVLWGSLQVLQLILRIYFARTYEDTHKHYRGAQRKLSFLASSHPHKAFYEVLWGSLQVLQIILRTYFAMTYENTHKHYKGAQRKLSFLASSHPHILTKPFMRSYEDSHMYYDVFLKFNLQRLMKILISVTEEPRGSSLF